MSVRFPEKAEVRLNKPPLREVICQVKFPTILRISNEPPINFQEAIRSRFPILGIEQGVIIQFGISPSFENPAIETNPKIYRFKSKDLNSNVALAQNFFALTTQAYSHWENFLADYKFIEQAIKDEFSIPFATRIGLRFINQFTEENTGCGSFDELLGLFRDELTCLIRSDALTQPDELITQIALPDGESKLILRFGYENDEKNQFFLLDFDYFEEGQLDFEDFADRIVSYHNQIYRAFRWCMNENSLDRFDPILGE